MSQDVVDKIEKRLPVWIDKHAEINCKKNIYTRLVKGWQPASETVRAALRRARVDFELCVAVLSCLWRFFIVGLTAMSVLQKDIIGRHADVVVTKPCFELTSGWRVLPQKFPSLQILYCSTASWSNHILLNYNEICFALLINQFQSPACHSYMSDKICTIYFLSWEKEISNECICSLTVHT